GLRLVSAGVFLLLARLIEPAAFGLAALAQVYLMVVQTLSDQGLTTALIQRAEIEEAHKDSAFWANLAVGLGLMLLTIAFADGLAGVYGEPRLAPVLRWYSLAPLLASLSVVQVALARRELRFRELALRQTAGAVMGGVVGVAMAFAGMGVWALVGQGLVTQATGVAVLWAIVDWRPRLVFSRRHFRQLFGFGFNVLATNIVRIVGGQADRLLLGYFFGAADVGYYSVAQRLVTIVTDFVAGSTERAVVPLFARIQGEKERVARGLLTAQRLLSLIVIPAFVGLAAVAPALIRVGVGGQWEPSILPTRILAFFSLAYCLGFFFGHVVTALGRPTLRLGVVLGQALVQAALSLLGVRYGIPGVAGAMAAAQIVFYGVELMVLRRLVRFSIPGYLREALLPALASAAMAAAVLALESALAGTGAGLRLAAGILLGTAVYGALLLAFGRARLREFVDLLQRLKG
ncbi:MAG TPA: lipopolysaccharide biosynthesis protein, partial [Dongiaceae bacterium]|nr:lipopolysaccharide biosynthesis protein [Dongiaceae bacterium]